MWLVGMFLYTEQLPQTRVNRICFYNTEELPQTKVHRGIFLDTEELPQIRVHRPCFFTHRNCRKQGFTDHVSLHTGTAANKGPQSMFPQPTIFDHIYIKYIWGPHGKQYGDPTLITYRELQKVNTLNKYNCPIFIYYKEILKKLITRNTRRFTRDR